MRMALHYLLILDFQKKICLWANEPSRYAAQQNTYHQKYYRKIEIMVKNVIGGRSAQLYMKCSLEIHHSILQTVWKCLMTFELKKSNFMNFSLRLQEICSQIC